MIRIETIQGLRNVLHRAVAAGHRVRFVPTMGALHEGHAALIRAARADGGYVLVSDFVNPTQFSPNEDFARYPRTPDDDAACAAAAGADAIWFPRVDDIYPAGDATRVTVGTLGTVWEGAHRPGHFDGVATVVAKLLAATQANVLYLGEKDYQQTVIVRQFVRDLLIPTDVVLVPTVREADGLALSSRNRYLSAEERRAAAAISRGLRAAAQLVECGQRDAALVRRALRDTIGAEPQVQVQYADLVNPVTLEPVQRLDAPARAIVAALVGTTHLIDNLLLLPITP